MINTKLGDITEAVIEGIIVQQANAQGVMGSGVAAAIRKKWPTVFEIYRNQVYEYEPNKAMGMMIPVQVTPALHICNIIGQEFYGRDGKRYTSYDALDDGFKKVKSYATTLNIEEINFPLIGSDLGGGAWSIVKAIILHNLPDFKLTLWINDPLKYNTIVQNSSE